VKRLEQEQAKMRERVRLEREKGTLADRRESTSKKETSPTRQWKPMVLSVRPEIRVITHRHRSGCRFVETRLEEDCKCKKCFYITAGKGERYRLSAKTPSWEPARIRARQWADQLDPNPRENQLNAVSMKLPFSNFVSEASGR
jgi:hypothetical protein